jgi:hypothetical protein
MANAWLQVLCEFSMLLYYRLLDMDRFFFYCSKSSFKKLKFALDPWSKGTHESRASIEGNISRSRLCKSAAMIDRGLL